MPPGAPDRSYFLHLADTLRGRHGVTRIEDLRKLRSSDGIMRSPMTGLSPFESTLLILHLGPCLRVDSSVTPIWFDTHGIRFHCFWISRIEWMGRIFHMTHIRGAAHVIRNIVGNRRKSSEIPSTRHAQRLTSVSKPGFQESSHRFSKTRGCQLSRERVRFFTRRLC